MVRTYRVAVDIKLDVSPYGDTDYDGYVKRYVEDRLNEGEYLSICDVIDVKVVDVLEMRGSNV